jgi:Kef-type K+ transport system membrane component KefB
LVEGDALYVAKVLGSLALILIAAKLLGEVFLRLRQPAVLGELLAGVVLGNLPLVGVGALGFVTHDPTIKVVAEIGVVLLLFEVGLESNLGQMLRVGASSFIVAIVGVVTPMALGYLAARFMLPAATWHVHVFIGAVLTATSVGITARVLKDLGKAQTVEGRIILGAAVIDDVLGLIVLAVVSGIVASSGTGGGVSAGMVLGIIGKAVAFLFGAILLGGFLSKRLFKVASWFHSQGLLLTVSLAVCFSFSYLAGLAGLAPIVGAFAAGLILDEVVYQPLKAKEPLGLEEQVKPIGVFLIPVFFVVTGSHVDLRVFADPSTLALAGLLTVAAIAGKQVCGLAVLERGKDRLSVGIGMIPRGEVGLIFAAVGANLVLPSGERVIDVGTNAAIVVMVFVTTILTPPALAWSLRRKATA